MFEGIIAKLTGAVMNARISKERAISQFIIAVNTIDEDDDGYLTVKEIVKAFKKAIA